MGDRTMAGSGQATPEHTQAMQAVALCLQLLEPHLGTLERLVEADRQLDTLGIILDPTLWKRARVEQRTRRNLERQVVMAGAAMDFVRVLRGIRDDVAAEASHG